MCRAFFGIVWLLVLAGVAAGDTRVDWNPSKDFHQYKTFSVKVEAPIDVGGSADERNTLAMDRLRQAVTRELEVRGLEQVDSQGDLTVWVSSRETRQANWVGSGWRYPYDYYSRWGMGYRPATYLGGWDAVWPYTYVKGTVRVDVVESKSGDLVYRAVHVDEINKHPDSEMNKAVRHAFKKYPVRGGFDSD